MHLGLISRRPRWGLTLRGWLALAGAAGAAALGLALAVHPFLALTDRRDADVLVVEGWVPDHAIRAACTEYHAFPYRFVLTTGGPLRIADPVSPAPSLADLGAIRLIRAGVPARHVHRVPAPPATRDRTHTAAVALRDWLRAHRVSFHRINIVTEGVHARRTRLLFARALGPGAEVGVIAVPDPEYDPRHWWRTSKGVRDVLGETISYAYARLLFSARAAPTDGPAAPPDSEPSSSSVHVHAHRRSR